MSQLQGDINDVRLTCFIVSATSLVGTVEAPGWECMTKVAHEAFFDVKGATFGTTWVSIWVRHDGPSDRVIDRENRKMAL